MRVQQKTFNTHAGTVKGGLAADIGHGRPHPLAVFRPGQGGIHPRRRHQRIRQAHIGRGKAQAGPAAVTVNDRTAAAVPAAQQARRGGHIAFGHAAPDAGRADDVAIQHHRVQLLHAKAVPPPQLAQDIGVSAATAPQGKIMPDDQRPQVQRHELLPHKVLRGGAGQVRREFQLQHLIHPQRQDAAPALRAIRQRGRGLSAAQHGTGMGPERQDAAAQSGPPAHFHRAPDEGLMPPVHAVEIADGQARLPAG